MYLFWANSIVFQTHTRLVRDKSSFKENCQKSRCAILTGSTVKAMLKSLTLLTYYLIPGNHHFRKLTIEGDSGPESTQILPPNL